MAARTIQIAPANDLHVHFRQDSPFMLSAVVRHSAKRCARALVMPNTKIPVTTAEHVNRDRNVATTGGSSQVAVDAAKAAGAEVVAVCVIVDREEGAKQRFAEQGIPLYSLLTLKELEERLQ